MKDGLLYILFVIFAVILVSSIHASTTQRQDDPSSYASVNDKTVECITPETFFSFRKLAEPGFLKFIENTFPDAFRIAISENLSSNSRLCQTEMMGIRHLKKKPLLLKIINSPEKEDHHPLS